MLCGIAVLCFVVGQSMSQQSVIQRLLGQALRRLCEVHRPVGGDIGVSVGGGPSSGPGPELRRDCEGMRSARGVSLGHSLVAMRAVCLWEGYVSESVCLSVRSSTVHCRPIG